MWCDCKCNENLYSPHELDFSDYSIGNCTAFNIDKSNPVWLPIYSKYILNCIQQIHTKL